MFTPRRRGAHAAPRGGDIAISVAASPPPAAPSPAVPPVTARREPSPAVRALGSVGSGEFRVAAAYLTMLPPAELESVVGAGRMLVGLAAAIIRTGRPGLEPPSGFTRCLGCLIGDCPVCCDPACDHYPLHHPSPAPSPAPVIAAGGADPEDGGTGGEAAGVDDRSVCD